MKYYATDHLKERLQERNIKVSDITKCLSDYHTDYASKDSEHCHCYIGNVNGRNLKVLVDNKKKVLITAYWLEIERRY